MKKKTEADSGKQTESRFLCEFLCHKGTDNNAGCDDIKQQVSAFFCSLLGEKSDFIAYCTDEHDDIEYADLLSSDFYIFEKHRKSSIFCF